MKHLFVLLFVVGIARADRPPQITLPALPQVTLPVQLALEPPPKSIVPQVQESPRPFAGTGQDTTAPTVADRYSKNVAVPAPAYTITPAHAVQFGTTQTYRRGAGGRICLSGG